MKVQFDPRFLKNFCSYKRVGTFLTAFVGIGVLATGLVLWRVQAHESDAQSGIKTASTQSPAPRPMPWQRPKLSAFEGILSPDPFAPSTTVSSFTPGNVVVCRMGDGVAPLTSAATPVFLEEYTPAGSLVQSILMPTAVSGANQILSASGVATNECHLTRSTDGKYLIITGYNAAAGTAGIATSSSATFPRVIGRVDALGVIDTSTTTTSFNAGGIRGATSDNGNNL